MRISDWSSDVCSSDLDDLVLADGQLRERVAAAVVLPREATCGHVVLLPDAIDVDVDVVGALRAAAKLGFTVVGRGEQHPGQDRKSVVSGKSVSVRVDLGGRRLLKKKIKNDNNR